MRKAVIATLIFLLIAIPCSAAGLRGEHQVSAEWVDGRITIVTSEVLSYELPQGVISFSTDYIKELNGKYDIITELAFTKTLLRIDFIIGINRKWISNSNKVFVLVCYPW